MKVFFTNAGRRTYMIEFALELATPKEPIEIYVGDQLLEAPAKHVSRLTIALDIPRVDAGEDAFAEAVLEESIKHGIDLVIPLSDFELAPLSRHKQRFLDAGVRLVVSDSAVIERTMSKKNAYFYCMEHDIPSPPSAFRAADYEGRFPCIVKPIEGSASRGIRFATGPAELQPFQDGVEMIQELIEGDEYGIDIFNDFEGNFVSATVKRKLLMRAGETDRAQIVNSPMLEALAKKIAETFRHNGNLDVDVIVDSENRLYCIDFNARFGGGYPTTHLSGMNYMGALVALCKGKPASLPKAPKPLVVVKGISLHVVAGFT